MMKKLILSLMLAGAALTAKAQYQFPNSTFDADFISSYGSYTEPEGWHGYATIDASSLNSAGRAGDKLVASTAVRSGASGKCVYVKSSSILGVVANGVLTNGQIYTHSTTATDGKNNYNFSDPANTGSSSTYGANNKFFTPFTGRPDYVKVWVKFAPASSGKGNARVSMILHKAGTKMYDPEDNADKSVVIARAAQSITAGDWQQLRVPFEYVSASDPGLILATFTTNETPGGGSDGDMLYIDDIEMEYISTITSATFNGEAIAFSGTSASVNAAYKEKYLKINTGAGASVTRTFNTANNVLTISIKGNDYSVNSSNTHTYTIQFTGYDAGLDDELDAVVTKETACSAVAPAEGWYYIKNKSTGAYMSSGTKTSSTPYAWHLSAGNNATVTDEAGNYIKISASLTSHSVNTSATSKDVDVLFNNVSGTYYQIYGSYSGLMSTYYTYLNDDNGTVSTKSSASTADNYQWEFIPVQLYQRVTYFWPNYSNASASNGVEVKGFRSLPSTESETIANLPLGIYEVTGTGLTGKVTVGATEYALSNGTTGKFYLPLGTDLLTALSSKDYTIKYYGRLDFSLNGTYNGTAITSSNGVYSCDELYTTADKLALTLGNGASLQNVAIDENSYVMTVTIGGYGRSRDTEVKMAEPDLSLNATWYGDEVEDGATINEAYVASKLVVTANPGTTATTTYNETTGVATITVSSSKESKEYKINFAIIPATVGEAKTYACTAVVLNGSSVSSTNLAKYKLTLSTLENGNISLTSTTNSINVGTLPVQNIPLAKDGSFSYTGYVRGTGSKAPLVPVTLYGVIKNGELVSASFDHVISLTSSKSLYHETYGFTSNTTKEYTNDIVVTINGDATTIADQTVVLKNLDNGNISFTLNNFKMKVDGEDTYIGNIFLENLPIESDGNFTFEGGILIGPGGKVNGQTVTWTGLDLGIVPVNLRGQRYNNGNDVIVVIDIDMQESLKQTIHVTMGAEAQSETTYNDVMKISVNGEETDVPNTKVVVGHLKNGNINFTLTDFAMNVNGKPSYIGNIAIDNIALDSKGNFTYNGVIRIGKGTDATKEWGGPGLGDVPVVIRGSVSNYTGGNSITTKASDGTTTAYTGSQCAIALDVDMQASLKQTIHVTYGLETTGSKTYTDVLAVTVNGETTTQNSTVTVSTLRNGNINFSLDNFALQVDEKTKQYIGNIALENLILDENGRFSYEGSIRIGKGSDTSVSSWGGPELGDVPLIVNGQMYTKDGKDYLMFNIDIDMEASLQQTINVTFGATPVSTKSYTDDLKVTVNGDATTQKATITVGELKNGYINFTLNNFALVTNGKTQYIGNIAINALELDENGKFSYKGNVRIGEGDLADVTSWGGPDLGAIPLDMKGQIYNYEDKEYLLVSIAIDMQKSINQTIDVLFGGTPIRTIDINDNLKVTINGQENNMKADVQVGVLRNGNINFTLRNFNLQLEGGVSHIGNLSIDNMELDGGNFSYNGVIRIGKGDDTSITSWGGPELGDIPVVLDGKFNESRKKLHAVLDIDMQETLSQIIYVEFGAEFYSLCDLVRVIKVLPTNGATKSDVNTIVDDILEK